MINTNISDFTTSLPGPVLGRIISMSGDLSTARAVCKRWKEITDSHAFPYFATSFRTSFLSQEIPSGDSQKSIVQQTFRVFYQHLKNKYPTAAQAFRNSHCPTAATAEFIYRGARLHAMVENLKGKIPIELLPVESPDFFTQTKAIQNWIKTLSQQEISQSIGESILISAAQNGLDDVIQDFQKFASPEARGLAVVNASSFGYGLLLELMLNSEKYGYPPDALDLVMSLLANEKIWRAQPCYSKVIKHLLSMGEISQQHRDLAFRYASSTGSRDIVEQLMSGKTMSKNSIIRAFYQASLFGRHDIVELLISKGEISEQTRGLAVRCASATGNPDVVKLLLQNGPISERDRGLAVKGSSSTGNPDVVKLLLQNGPISKKDRGLAVLCAASSGGLSLGEKKKGEEKLKDLINQRNTIELLLQNGPISKDDIDEAITFASISALPETIDLLQMQKNSALDETIDQSQMEKNKSFGCILA